MGDQSRADERGASGGTPTPPHDGYVLYQMGDDGHWSVTFHEPDPGPARRDLLTVIHEAARADDERLTELAEEARAFFDPPRLLDVVSETLGHQDPLNAEVLDAVPDGWAKVNGAWVRLVEWHGPDADTHRMWCAPWKATTNGAVDA